MLSLLLVMYSFMTPLIAGLLLRSGIWASVLTFCSVFAFWGTTYTAVELEKPFGDDENDLPIASMQEDMNSSLWVLLDIRAQDPPEFSFDKYEHRQYATTKQTRGGKTGKRSSM